MRGLDFMLRTVDAISGSVFFSSHGCFGRKGFFYPTYFQDLGVFYHFDSFHSIVVQFCLIILTILLSFDNPVPTGISITDSEAGM